MQVQCVSCIMALIKRKPGMEAVLARPHAVTCLLAALSSRAADKSRRVQREVRELAVLTLLTSCHTGHAHSTLLGVLCLLYLLGARAAAAGGAHTARHRQAASLV